MSRVKAYGLVFLLSLGVFCALGWTGFHGQTVRAAGCTCTLPIVFQAAGPTVATIQSATSTHSGRRLGKNNGNTPGPLATGRREINWDGGGSTATSPAPNPVRRVPGEQGCAFHDTRGPASSRRPSTGSRPRSRIPRISNTVSVLQPGETVQRCRVLNHQCAVLRAGRRRESGYCQRLSAPSSWTWIRRDPTSRSAPGGRRRDPELNVVLRRGRPHAVHHADSRVAGRRQPLIPGRASSTAPGLRASGSVRVTSRLDPNDSSATTSPCWTTSSTASRRRSPNPALLQLMLTQPTD